MTDVPGRSRPARSLEQIMLNLRILTAAFMATPVVLIIVAYTQAESGSFGQGEELGESAINVLFGVACFFMLISLYLPQLLMKSKTGASGPVKSSRGEPVDKLALGNFYFTVVIISYAMRETGVVIGFVLSLLTGNFNWVLGLGVAFIVLMIMTWPKQSVLEGYFRNSGGN